MFRNIFSIIKEHSEYNEIHKILKFILLFIVNENINLYLRLLNV